MKCLGKYWLALWLLCLVATTRAQDCTVVLKSIDSTDLFTVTLNNEIQNTVFVNQIALSKLTFAQNYKATVHFKGDSIPLVGDIYLLENNYTHYYTIDKANKKLQLDKIVASNYVKEDPNQYLVICEKKTPPTAVIEQPKVVLEDTTDLAYRMEGYEGKVGCERPMSDDAFSKHLLEIKKQPLEDEKMLYIENNIKSNCLSTIQANQLLQTFTFEETKFEVLKLLIPQLHDIERIEQLTHQHIFYESMRELLFELSFNSYQKK